MSNTKIIYHKINKLQPCPDGETAAWTALKKYPDAEVIGWEYQTEPPLAADELTGFFKLLFRSLFEKNAFERAPSFSIDRHCGNSSVADKN